MIRDIEAKTLLAPVKQPEPLFGLKYNMNLYRGCQHQCIYCDSRSDCYGIEDFRDILVKTNALDLLPGELASKRVRGTIGFGSMNDCYMPIEAERQLTRQALELIVQHRFPVHILTKSDLVLRDLDLLEQIASMYAAVTFTVTTADDDLGRKLEPGASPVSARLRAMATLAAHGIHTGVAMMPILPFIEDTEENVSHILEQTASAGGQYILPWFGMTMREGQRQYFYDRLDELFPGLRQRYEEAYGDRYECPVPGAARLGRRFESLCQQRGMATRMPAYSPDPATQLSLF